MQTSTKVFKYYLKYCGICPLLGGFCMMHIEFCIQCCWKIFILKIFAKSYRTTKNLVSSNTFTDDL